MPVDLSQPPSAALPHPGVPEVEGVVPRWRGWTLLRAVTWFVAHPQICRHGPAASQATGNHLIWDVPALLVCQRELRHCHPIEDPSSRAIFGDQPLALERVSVRKVTPGTQLHVEGESGLQPEWLTGFDGRLSLWDIAFFSWWFGTKSQGQFSVGIHCWGVKYACSLHEGNS